MTCRPCGERCSSRPSSIHFTHRTLPLQLCPPRCHRHPFTSLPAVPHSSFRLHHPSPGLHTQHLFSYSSSCPSLHPPVPTLTTALVRHPAVDKATPPPPLLHYILSNKPERTNISSPHKLPLPLKPSLHLALSYVSDDSG